MARFQLLFLCSAVAVCSAQLSKPFASNKAHGEHAGDNMFVKRDILAVENFMFGKDHSGFQTKTGCPLRMHLRWQTELDGSVYATPVITDLNSDGVKDIVAPTFLRHVEVLDGHHGHSVPGWPFTFPNSVFHSSPLMYDIDGDGFLEIGLVTFNAEIVWLYESGTPVFGRSIRIPPLRVMKHWYQGLDLERNNNAEMYNSDHPANHYGDQAKNQHATPPHPHLTGRDAEHEEEAEEATEDHQATGAPTEAPTQHSQEDVNTDTADTPQQDQPAQDQPRTEQGSAPAVMKQAKPDRRKEAAKKAQEAAAAAAGAAAQKSGKRTLLAALEDDPGHDVEEDIEPLAHKPLHGTHEGTWSALQGWLSEEGTESLLSVLPDHRERMLKARDTLLLDSVLTSVLELSDDDVATLALKDEELQNAAGNETAASSSTDQEELPGSPKQRVPVDAHVFSTPVIADIDNDGHDELIVAVSYFFSKERFNDPAAYQALDVDVEVSKYVAGGVAVYDLVTGKKKWNIHLDLTTDETKFRAYIYSSPTVADVDGDGYMEIVVGTSVGFIYVLEHTGVCKSGFPVQMAEIQGPVVIADINSDGNLELVACDTHHNVAAWSTSGHVVWERHISGFSAQGAVIGDVDGDGTVDVVIATGNGHIWALQGKDGSVLKSYPIRVGGRILAPLALIHLHTQQSPLHIVVPVHDGKLYLINGRTTCAFKVDIAEQSYSMVLADDMTGNGKLDLVVTTMNGHVLVFGTDTDYHPSIAWTSREQGRSNFQSMATSPRVAVYATAASRVHRDISGSQWKIEFEIVDERPQKLQKGPYKIKITIGGRIVLLEKEYPSAGVQVELIRAPRRRQYASIVLELTNEHKQSFFDTFSVSFNMHFYRTLKWVLVGPFVLMFLIVMFVSDSRSSLPL